MAFFLKELTIAPLELWGCTRGYRMGYINSRCGVIFSKQKGRFLLSGRFVAIFQYLVKSSGFVMWDGHRPLGFACLEEKTAEINDSRK